MAWRPHDNLMDGVLDNTQSGRVTGWLRFVGLPGPVRLELEGDFHRDIRGAQLAVRRPVRLISAEEACARMRGFAAIQAGQVGDITAGLSPCDYGDYPYIEWYSKQNGRVVLELSPQEATVVGTPLPWEEQEPLSRTVLDERLLEFVEGMQHERRVPVIIVRPKK